MDCLGFITLGIYTLLKRVCIAHNNCMSCPSIWATLSALLINILWVPSSCFCIVISLFWGWNNPVQRCLPVGGGCIIHAGGGGGFTHWLTDCFDVQPTTTSATSSRRASFSALASANSSVVFCIERSNITLTHLHVSNCRVRQLQFSGIFVALGFVGNGVITVMINSPWQADDDADNQSGDNRGDSAHTSISLTVPPGFFEFCNQAVSLMPELTITSARQWKAQILLQRSIAWRISPRSIIGKAPRSLICCNATASWLFERSPSGQAVCGRASHQRERSW